ncbi:hypothetical protein [uncultured Chryseobacterium sp.]|uniref:hypothetical protein n=1 Tax=uncultured Chryseobacterium sp. TaxID=259322 RepID=UPI0025D3A6F2|nr:hypothetical protein [uncultured Chryseobacterium sp.]
MKKFVLCLFLLVFLQSCYYPVHKDYGIYSKSLVFSGDKKWLINTIRTTADSHHREMMALKTLELFQNLSHNKAYPIETVKQGDIIKGTIPADPQTEDLEALEALKTDTDFDYLVNISTFKVRNGLDGALGTQYEYQKNETFAMMEVYDIKTLKKIYSLKSYSEVSVDKGQKATIFTPGTEMMTMKNFMSLLKSVKKNAVITY